MKQLYFFLFSVLCISATYLNGSEKKNDYQNDGMTHVAIPKNQDPIKKFLTEHPAGQLCVDCATSCLTGVLFSGLMSTFFYTSVGNHCQARGLSYQQCIIDDAQVTCPVVSILSYLNILNEKKEQQIILELKKEHEDFLARREEWKKENLEFNERMLEIRKSFETQKKV